MITVLKIAVSCVAVCYAFIRLGDHIKTPQVRDSYNALVGTIGVFAFALLLGAALALHW